MHRGFNFKSSFNSSSIDSYLATGNEIYVETKKKIRPALTNYISPDGSIDGSKMQEDWFPQVNADVFISHSHKDEAKAIALAGWLYSNFGLSAFIDSCIWGFCDELLREIDEKYCFNLTNNTFIYENRNYSTSHVHMMLSTALGKMMDKAECLFFINTNNSITASGMIEHTESPWIYSEITMSQLIKISPTGREKVSDTAITQSMSERTLLESMPTFKYKVGLSHLTDVDENSLRIWLQQRSDNTHPLDTFYNQNKSRIQQYLILHG